MADVTAEVIGVTHVVCDKCNRLRVAVAVDGNTHVYMCNCVPTDLWVESLDSGEFAKIVSRLSAAGESAASECAMTESEATGSEATGSEATGSEATVSEASKNMSDDAEAAAAAPRKTKRCRPKKKKAPRPLETVAPVENEVTPADCEPLVVEQTVVPAPSKETKKNKRSKRHKKPAASKNDTDIEVIEQAIEQHAIEDLERQIAYTMILMQSTVFFCYMWVIDVRLQLGRKSIMLGPFISRLAGCLGFTYDRTRCIDQTFNCHKVLFDDMTQKYARFKKTLEDMVDLVESTKKTTLFDNERVPFVISECTAISTMIYDLFDLRAKLDASRIALIQKHSCNDFEKKVLQGEYDALPDMFVTDPSESQARINLIMIRFGRANMFCRIMANRKAHMEYIRTKTCRWYLHDHYTDEVITPLKLVVRETLFVWGVIAGWKCSECRTSVPIEKEFEIAVMPCCLQSHYVCRTCLAANPNMLFRCKNVYGITHGQSCASTVVKPRRWLTSTNQHKLRLKQFELHATWRSVIDDE